MRLLIINPNTSEHVTRALSAHIAPMLGEDWQVDCVTARFGARYIASEVAYAIAAHAVLDAWSCRREDHDAILIACFGDPGLEALRELATCPVVGLAEASMQEAEKIGRFAIVTGGDRWTPILRRRSAAAGLMDKLLGLKVLSQSGAELLADSHRALDLLEQAARELSLESGAEAVIIGGAALAGMGEKLARRLPFTVIDNVSAAARAIRDSQPHQPHSRPDSAEYSGLGSELMARLALQHKHDCQP